MKNNKIFVSGLVFALTAAMAFPAAAQDGSRQDAEQNDRRTAYGMEAAPGRRLLDVMFHGSSESRSGPGSSLFGFAVPPEIKHPFRLAVSVRLNISITI